GLLAAGAEHVVERGQQGGGGAVVGGLEDLAGGGVVAQPVHEPGGVRQVGGALAVEERQHDDAAAGLDRLPVAAEQARHLVDGLGAVERAGQRQPVVQRVGEPGDDAGGVLGVLPGDRVDGAGGAEAEYGGAGFEAEAEGGGHVVAGAGGDGRAFGQRPAGLDGASLAGDDPGQQRGVEPDVAQQVGVVALGRPPAGAGGVAAAGDALAGQAFGEVVVRQPSGGGPLGVVRLVLAQPGPLGDGERRGGHAAAAPGEGFGAVLVDQRGGLPGGADVVPEHGGPDGLAGVVEGDQAVLLAADGDGAGPVGPAGLLDGRAERPPPLLGVALAARAGGDGVRGTAFSDDGAAVHVYCDGLGRLGGAVDPDHDALCRHGASRVSGLPYRASAY